MHPTRWARTAYGGALDNKYVRGVFNRSCFNLHSLASLLYVQCISNKSLTESLGNADLGTVSTKSKTDEVPCRSWRGVIGSLSGCYCCASAILDVGAIFAGTCGGSFGLNLM